MVMCLAARGDQGLIKSVFDPNPSEASATTSGRCGELDRIATGLPWSARRLSTATASS